MRVLLIHSSDFGRGGAILAMNRLHLGLRKAGVDSRIFCRHKKLESDDSIAFPQSYLLNKIEGRLGQVTRWLGLNDLHNLSTFLITKTQAYQTADVLDFHGVHTGFFNYFAFPSLTAHKPAVLTLHDMWLLTGHCAFSFNCERWKAGCGKCPDLNLYPAVRRDNTRLEWKFKDWVYNHSRFAIVTPSKWLADLAKQSMLSRFAIHQIPYGIDTEVFRPLGREQCRLVLGIPSNKNVLLFSAMKLSQSEGDRKGGDLLLKALHSLPASLKAETVLLLVGDRGEALARATGMDTLSLGYVESDHFRAIAYSAADLFLLPTRADNFPLVSLESQACGTPVVAFRVGGVPEQVRPGITGFLAEPENTAQFSSGILQLLEDSSLRDEFGRQGRAVVVEEYSLDVQVRRYSSLYRQLLGSTGETGKKS